MNDEMDGKGMSGLSLVKEAEAGKLMTAGEPIISCGKIISNYSALLISSMP